MLQNECMHYYSVKRFDSSIAFSKNKKKKIVYSKFGVYEFSVFIYSLIHSFSHCNCISLIGLQPVYTKCTVITKTYYIEAILTQETAYSGLAIWHGMCFAHCSQLSHDTHFFNMNMLWNEEDKEKNIKGCKQKEVLGSLLFQQKWW
jgi:hypothetical protein